MGAKLLGKLKLWTKQMQILLDRFPFFHCPKKTKENQRNNTCQGVNEVTLEAPTGDQVGTIHHYSTAKPSHHGRAARRQGSQGTISHQTNGEAEQRHINVPSPNLTA